MNYIYNDGGRSKYFQVDNVGDCVCRAIAIANDLDYKIVYDTLNKLAKTEKINKHKKSKSSARNGMYKDTYKKYLENLGWTYYSTCKVGKGISMHLTETEVPDGIVICQVSKHIVCIKDKVINDTYNSSIKKFIDYNGQVQINDRRAVYGYWVKENESI